MSVQTVYNDAPQIGLHGQMTDIGNAKASYSAPAQVEIGAGLGVAKGTDITGTYTQVGFGLQLPSATYPILVGISVRTVGMEGEPPNTQASVPVYRPEQMATYLSKGSMWIKLEVAVSAYEPVFVVNVGAGGALGTITNVDDANTIPLTGARFMQTGGIGDVVKVVLN